MQIQIQRAKYQIMRVWIQVIKPNKIVLAIRVIMNLDLITYFSPPILPPQQPRFMNKNSSATNSSIMKNCMLSNKLHQSRLIRDRTKFPNPTLFSIEIDTIIQTQ